VFCNCAKCRRYTTRPKYNSRDELVSIRVNGVGACDFTVQTLFSMLQARMITDHTYLSCVDTDKRVVYVYNATTYKCIHNIHIANKVENLFFLDKKQLAIATSKEIHIWSITARTIDYSVPKDEIVFTMIKVDNWIVFDSVTSLLAYNSSTKETECNATQGEPHDLLRVNASRFISSHDAGLFCVWQVGPLQPVQNIKFGTEAIYSMDWWSQSQIVCCSEKCIQLCHSTPRRLFAIY
jgi:hypothetical protein